jgi:hypothetical protein
VTVVTGVTVGSASSWPAIYSPTGEVLMGCARDGQRLDVAAYIGDAATSPDQWSMRTAGPLGRGGDQAPHSG